MPESELQIEEAQSSRLIYRWKTDDGVFHRDDGPAYERWFVYSGSELEVQCWIRNGEFYGPMAFTLREVERTERVMPSCGLTAPLGDRFDYPMNDSNRRHREDGPAVVLYHGATRRRAARARST